MSQILALPEVSIDVQDVALSGTDLRALREVRVQQRLSLPTLCELTFSDPPGPLAGVVRLVPGAALRVAVAGQQEPLFSGQVTAIEHVYGASHELEVHVRGYDLLHRLRKRQAVCSHVQVTARDLAQELVADLGLTVQAMEAGPLWQHLIQYRQSDLELLQEVAERCGLYLTVRGTILHLLTLRGLGEALPLAPGEKLLEAKIEVNADAVCRLVTATGWDQARVEVHQAQVSQARVGRTASAEVAPASVGGSGKRELIDEDVSSNDHAEGIAQAELDLRVAQEVTLWGIAEGDTRLRPGAPVEIRGVAETVAGRYVLSAVTHTIDAHKGFLSEISSTPPPQRIRTRSHVAAPGVVTQIDDPERLGRIRVALPTYNSVETDWMGVLSAGAGAGKGFMTLPDIGDHVLVLFAHEDPSQGIVLGGLYGANVPPDVGIDAGAVQRYTLLTPGGQRIRLDDGQKTIRLENSSGSYYELSPQRVRVHAAADLLIEAPGQHIVIRGQNIDFEKG